MRSSNPADLNNLTLQRRTSLTWKVNILLVALVLLTAALLFFSSERAFQHAVLDPCTRKLSKAEVGTKMLDPYVRSLLHYAVFSLAIMNYVGALSCTVIAATTALFLFRKETKEPTDPSSETI